MAAPPTALVAELAAEEPHLRKILRGTRVDAPGTNRDEGSPTMSPEAHLAPPPMPTAPAAAHRREPRRAWALPEEERALRYAFGFDAWRAMGDADAFVLA